ncbi:flavin reductase family protein [Paucidesulfovibrio longus]|uniref:flavin reductase family protein n=1 Tax=Paucidesulfovibrio longus TaxID=889 RepID=UPI0003B498DE|nr:flavin reductase family protein [Paucidesulfovibrio longus]
MKVSLGAEILAMPTPVWIVGSYDAEDKPNAMTIAWGGVCCSKPPCVGVSLRKATYTYDCILARKAFTVSIPSESNAKEADYFGMASGRDVDKFAATGLTPVRSEVVDAPYVGEFPLVLECRLLQTVEIGLHTQFVGEIMDVKADENVLVGGKPALDKVLPLLYGTGSKSYFRSGPFLGKGFSIGRGYMG